MFWSSSPTANRFSLASSSASVLSGERRDELVLGLTDVLILVDQDPVEAPEHLLAGDERGRFAAPEQASGVAQHVVECVSVRVGSGLGEGPAENAHCERVAGHDVDAAGVASDQFVEAPPRFHRRVAVVRQCQNASRILATHADEVGDAVHQHPGLARSRSREHQHVGALAVVGDDLLLGPVAELPDDLLVVPREGISAQRRLLPFEPLVDELVVGEAEVIGREAQRQADVGHAEPCIFGNEVDLRSLLAIVFLQRLEVRHP